MSKFDFEKLVEGFVVAIIKDSERAKVALDQVAQKSLQNLVDDALSDLDTDLGDAEGRLFDNEIATESIEKRVSCLERESIYEEDFGRLEQDFLDLKNKVEPYLPLLEMLNKAAPILKIMGVFKEKESKTSYLPTYNVWNPSSHIIDQKPNYLS